VASLGTSSMSSKVLLFEKDPRPHRIHGSLGPNSMHTPNGISISSSAFAWLTVMTNRQRERQTHTDRTTQSVAIGHVYLELPRGVIISSS